MILRPLSFALAFLSLSAAPLAAVPAPTPLAPELQTAVRCAALFSVVAAEQTRGAPTVRDWPPLAQRGREFFVRVGAQVMDRAGLDRAGVQALMRREAEALRDPAARWPAPAAALKTPCLAMLDAAIPAGAVRQP